MMEWRNLLHAPLILMVIATVTNGQIRSSMSLKECLSGRVVSCVMPPCDSKSCPAFPMAQCRNSYCDGCNVEFWIGATEVTSQCDQTRQADQIMASETDPSPCPNGVVKCFMNPCQSAKCPNRPVAICKSEDCTCRPTFWEGTLDVTDQCQPDIDTGKQNSQLRQKAGMPSLKPCINQRRVNCQMAPCTTNNCDRHPNAQCRNNYCGGCQAEFWVGLREVTDECSTADISLKQGDSNIDVIAQQTSTSDQSAPMICKNTCLFPPCLLSYCAAFPQAKCRYDTCKGCVAQFMLGQTDVTSRCTERVLGLRRWGGIFSRYRQPQTRNVFTPWLALLDGLF